MPHGDDCKLVHDLRGVNLISETERPVVPDAHSLLSTIPADAKWHTIINFFLYSIASRLGM